MTAMRRCWTLSAELARSAGVRLEQAACPHAPTARSCASSASSSSHTESDSAAPLPILVASRRETSRSKAANLLRRAGFLPGILDSIDGGTDRVMLKLNPSQVERYIRDVGRRPFMARRFDLHILQSDSDVESFSKDDSVDLATVSERYRVLPKTLHINAVDDWVENVGLMHCPDDRPVTVDVPVRTTGDGNNVSLSRGGYILHLRWTLRVKCLGADVPASFSVNVADMAMGQVVHMRDVDMPDGVTLAEPDPDQPVVKLAGRIRA